MINAELVMVKAGHYRVVNHSGEKLTEIRKKRMWHRVNYDYWIVNGDSTEYPSLTMAVKKLDRKYNFTNFPGPLNVLRNIGYTKPPYSKK